jgi:hypothetical protein
MPLPFDMPIVEIAGAARKASDIQRGGDVETLIARMKADGAKRNAAADARIAALVDLNSRLRGDLRRNGPLPGWTRATTIEAPVAPDSPRHPPTEAANPLPGENLGGPNG